MQEHIEVLSRILTACKLSLRVIVSQAVPHHGRLTFKQSSASPVVRGGALLRFPDVQEMVLNHYYRFLVEPSAHSLWCEEHVEPCYRLRMELLDIVGFEPLFACLERITKGHYRSTVRLVSMQLKDKKIFLRREVLGGQKLSFDTAIVHVIDRAMTERLDKQVIGWNIIGNRTAQVFTTQASRLVTYHDGTHSWKKIPVAQVQTGGCLHPTPPLQRAGGTAGPQS